VSRQIRTPAYTGSWLAVFCTPLNESGSAGSHLTPVKQASQASRPNRIPEYPSDPAGGRL